MYAKKIIILLVLCLCASPVISILIYRKNKAKKSINIEKVQKDNIEVARVGDLMIRCGDELVLYGGYSGAYQYSVVIISHHRSYNLYFNSNVKDKVTINKCGYKIIIESADAKNVKYKVIKKE